VRYFKKQAKHVCFGFLLFKQERVNTHGHTAQYMCQLPGSTQQDCLDILPCFYLLYNFRKRGVTLVVPGISYYSRGPCLLVLPRLWLKAIGCTCLPPSYKENSGWPKSRRQLPVDPIACEMLSKIIETCLRPAVRISNHCQKNFVPLIWLQLLPPTKTFLQVAGVSTVPENSPSSSCPLLPVYGKISKFWSDGHLCIVCVENCLAS